MQADNITEGHRVRAAGQSLHRGHVMNTRYVTPGIYTEAKVIVIVVEV